MKVYETKDIRNVAVLGHGSAGKTTIVEAAAFVTGVISRMGKVTDGSTISDFDKEEVKRGFSLSPRGMRVGNAIWCELLEIGEGESQL